MGRPRTTSDEAILEAARELFRERGHAVSTREVAAAAGVSQAVLFQRFPSKSALFFAAMAPSAPDVERILGAEVLPVEKYLEGVAGRILKYFEQLLPTVIQLMAHPEFGEKAMAHLHEHFVAQELIDALGTRLEDFRERKMIGDVDPHASALTIIATLHSIVVFRVFGGVPQHRRAGRLGQELLDVLWRGLAPRR